MNETAGCQGVPGNITGNGNRQRIVSGREIEKFMDRGYEVFTTLPSGKVVMKLPLEFHFTRIILIHLSFMS